ncbi:MAG: hypothetical protein ABSC23_13545 [Bryobacteraceae bacterium]
MRGCLGNKTAALATIELPVDVVETAEGGPPFTCMERFPDLHNEKA